MELSLNEILLGLFVINIGLAFGAGLYETRITLPLWFIKSPKGLQINTEMMIKMDVGRRFWGFVTTIPLTLLTIASLIFAFQMNGAAKNWWLAAAQIILAERFGTFFYFIPTAIKMTKADTFTANKASSMALQWKRMNGLRLVLNMAAWLAALMAFYFSAAAMN